MQGGRNNKAQLAKKEPHTKLPFVKRISKGEFSNDSEVSNRDFYSNVEKDTDSDESLTFPIREEDIEESKDRDLSQTVSLPYPIRVEELDELEPEDAELEFSTLLADQSASDRAHEDKAADEVMERLGIPRPLNGPTTIVNDKYILLNSLQKRMCPRLAWSAWV